MADENRLTAKQLAALSPGDQVVIETSGDFRRPKLCAGAVVRIEGPRIVVSTRSPRGVPYVDRFACRDGVRIGGGSRAELVNGDPTNTVVTSDQRRRQMRVDAAYRAWARNRGDLERLRELQAAITQCLDESFAGTQ